jgi:lipopolysaccharide transport system ATP-binding protein
MSAIIKVENLSKAYQLGEIGTGTLSRDLERYWAKIRGKEDPFLKIGEVNDRSRKGESDIVWSLKDINFDIEQGDAVGIIGRNGAGKSTLLKILSRVTAPTTGSVKVKGRVASLLEVGTGFHPELSGRENIYLNGAILGMRKVEIKRKFDEIVDFSGVERYIDTPVKRYSSGMYVRLAFAVAAHLESEILIVDEVLAVGDAEFQKKCLGKMGDVSKGEGRTVLFVSHNMGAIISLCNKGIYLKNGQVTMNGSVEAAMKTYADDRGVIYSKNVKILNEGKKAWLSDFRITDEHKNEHIQMETLKIVHIEIESSEHIENIFIGIGINDVNDVRIMTLFSKFYNKKYSLKTGKNQIQCQVGQLNLKPGTYKTEVFIGNDIETVDYYDSGLQFEIFLSSKPGYLLPDSSQGSIFINQIWI